MRFLRRTTVIVPILLILLFELGCGDQYRPIANPIVSPGGQPQATHFAFVLNYNPSGGGSSTKIDVSGDSNLQVVTTGLGSVAQAFQGSNAGAMFVANRDSDTVSEFTLIASSHCNQRRVVSGIASGQPRVHQLDLRIRSEFRNNFGLPNWWFVELDQHRVLGGHQHGVRGHESRAGRANAQWRVRLCRQPG